MALSKTIFNDIRADYLAKTTNGVPVYSMEELRKKYRVAKVTLRVALADLPRRAGKKQKKTKQDKEVTNLNKALKAAETVHAAVPDLKQVALDFWRAVQKQYPTAELREISLTNEPLTIHIKQVTTHTWELL